MKARTLAIFALALLAAAGCRSDPRIAPLEQELRLQEDRIYELEDLVARYEQALADCQGQTPVQDGPAIMQPPSGPPASPAPDASGRVEMPRVEMPAEPAPPGQVPQTLRTSPGSQPPSPSEAAAPSRGDWRSGAGSRQVARITLNGLFTGGYDADGRPGDEGITASIEPRDADGRLVAAAAPVSMALLDPAQQGEAARVARWDFTAEEIAAMGQTARMSEGIHLAVTWPGKPPAHERLQLFVRYTTADGRKLEVDQPIEVEIAGRQARRWTTAAPVARPPEPSRPAVSPARRADPAPTRSWSPAPQAAQAPAAPARTAARPAKPPAEPSEPSQPRRKRPAWSPYR